MARPHKQIVDYFPHDTDASEGKTLTIIQNKFGNDGYAFWYKLLQLLGKSPGHYFDFNEPEDWEFLLAKTHINDTEKARDILKTLSILKAIDSELYEHGVIWCQKFVNGISEAYKRTVDGIPQRPDFLVNVINNDVSVQKDGVSANINTNNATEIPQTKLNKTKRDNNILPDWIDKDLWNAFLEMRKKIKKPPTDKAVELLIKDLEKYKAAGDEPNEVIKKSIMNGWAGLFPLSNKGGQSGARQQRPRQLPDRESYTRPEDYGK